MIGSALQDLSSKHHKIEAYVCRSHLNIMKVDIFIKDYKLLFGHMKVFGHVLF